MRRVLIADDSDDLREMLRELLRGAPFEVILAASGQETIEKYTQAAMGGKPISLLVLDVAMPDMTGITAAETIRAAGFETPVIFFSAYPSAISHARAHHLHPLDFWEKPLEVEGLINRIEQALDGQSESPVAQHRAKNPEDRHE